jgi:heat shock protein HslJ
MKSRTRIIGLVILLFLLGLVGYKLITPDTVDPLDGTSWELLSYGGQYPVEGSTIIANFEDSLLDGFVAGCNDFFGPYEIEGNTIDLFEVWVTLESCGDTLDQQQENLMDFIWYVETLEINAKGQLLI